jgi:hypothetical protein
MFVLVKFVDKQKSALWGVGVFGSLGLFILVIHLLSRTNRFLEQSVVKMPVPDAIIIGAQDSLIRDRVGADFEAKYGKNGKKIKANNNNSLVTSAAVLPGVAASPVVAAPIANRSTVAVNIGNKRGIQDIASSTEFSILNANNQVIEKLQASQKFRFSAQPNGIQIGEKIYTDSVILQPKDNGQLFLDGHWHRGTFTVTRTADLLLVVNNVSP